MSEQKESAIQNAEVGIRLEAAIMQRLVKERRFKQAGAFKKLHNLTCEETKNQEPKITETYRYFRETLRGHMNGECRMSKCYQNVYCLFSTSPPNTLMAPGTLNVAGHCTSVVEREDRADPCRGLLSWS